MATALNNFRTSLITLPSSWPNTNDVNYETVTYSPPQGYATVILMAQVSNNGAATVTTSARVRRLEEDGSTITTTSLIKEASVPVNDAINILTGRLILQENDTLQIISSDGSTTQLVLSYLETLITGQ